MSKKGIATLAPCAAAAGAGFVTWKAASQTDTGLRGMKALGASAVAFFILKTFLWD